MCHHGMCFRCWGFQKLLVGALLLLNAFVWPQWLGVDGWVAFVAVLMVLGGFMKLLWPTCMHCKGMDMKPMQMKKKR